MNKLISIILPTYNDAKWIKDAIESVLNQSYENWELLVIDDGSIDDTESLIQRYVSKDKRIIYIKNEKNLGIQKSLNKGLENAKGEYIARIDSDDKWIDHNKLKKQIEFLENNREYVLVGTGVLVFNEKNKEIFRYLNPESDLDIRSNILFKNCFTHSSVLFRKDKAMIFGGYSEKIDVLHLEDYDLWLKLGTIGKMYNLPIYAVSFLMRKDGLSIKNKSVQFKRNIRLIKKYKNIYPKYKKALLLNYLRLIVYPIFKIFPIQSIKNKFIKIYKLFK